MTTPAERTRAVQWTAKLLVELSQYHKPSRKNALVPAALVEQLVGRLRHYPTDFDLERSHEAAPYVWGEPEK